MKDKLKLNLILFWNFFKIGLFTFGGGLAMLPLIEKIVVERYKWMTRDETVDMVAIAESTPGVIAINFATYVGYKMNKFIGSLLTTLGVILPSLIIICLISFFYEKFINIEIISWIFKGIKACVAILILNAGLKLLKNCPKNVYSVFILLIAFFLSLFVPTISTIYIILSGLILGIIVYTIYEKRKSKNEVKEELK